MIDGNLISKLSGPLNDVKINSVVGKNPVQQALFQQYNIIVKDNLKKASLSPCKALGKF